MLESKQFESWFESAKLNGVLFDSEYDASKITWHSAMIHFKNRLKKLNYEQLSSLLDWANLDEDDLYFANAIMDKIIEISTQNGD